MNRFQTDSDTGLRVCLTVCVEDAWQGQRAAAAAEAIGQALVSMCEVRNTAALPVGVGSGLDVVGEAWIRVRRYAATLAASERPLRALARLVTFTARDISTAEAPFAEVAVEPATMDVWAEDGPSLPGLPDSSTSRDVEWEDAPVLSELVELLVEEGAAEDWARTAIAQVADVAASSSSSEIRRRRLSAKVRRGEVSLEAAEARHVADLLTPRYSSHPDVPPPLWRLAMGEELTVEDRRLIRSAAVHGAPREVGAA